MTKIEYRVKAVERYIITRFEGSDDGKGIEGVSERGIHSSPHVAYEVAYALCKSDHERLGYPLGDERIKYPEPPRPNGVSPE